MKGIELQKQSESVGVATREYRAVMNSYTKKCKNKEKRRCKKERKRTEGEGKGQRRGEEERREGSGMEGGCLAKARTRLQQLLRGLDNTIAIAMPGLPASTIARAEVTPAIPAPMTTQSICARQGDTDSQQ